MIINDNTIEEISIVVEDRLDDPNNIDEGDHNPELEEIISEWNLDSAIYAILVQHGISVQYLKLLDDRALDDVFSVARWTGHKYALRQKLVSWPESVMYHTATTSKSLKSIPDEATAPPATVLCKQNPLKHRLLPTSVTAELLDDILKRNEKGKIVVKYFSEKQKLDAAHRKYLAHTIVDYYIANDLYFSLPDMTKFAQLIVGRFPNELTETYFNPRDVKVGKNHPTGLIYDRFHNRNKKKFAKPGSSSDKETAFFKAKSAALQLSLDEIEQQTAVKNWLRNNFAPAEEVLQKWRDSSSLRLRTIWNDVDVDKGGVLNEWPRILDDTGYLLIDSDFVELFGNSDKLFNNWDFFTQNFLDYVQNNDIKDDFSRQLLTALDESVLGQDGRDYIVCMVFHALIKPTRTSTRKLPTILQAQTDVC